MFEFFKNILEKRMQLPSLVAVADNIKSIIDLAEKEYAQDKNARDALIDTAIQLLQEHKTQHPQV